MALLATDTIHAPIFDNIPVEMRELNHWVLWRAMPNRDKPEKLDKRPYNPDGTLCSGNYQQGEQYSFSQVKTAYETGKFDGIGFIFNNDSGMTAIDLDSDSIEHIPERYKVFIDRTYSEKSISGNGYHSYIFGRRLEGYGNKSQDRCFEIYDDKRFMVVTGNTVNSTSVKNLEGTLHMFMQKYMQPLQTPAPTPQGGAFPVSELSAEQVLANIARSESDSAKRLYDLLVEGENSTHATGDASADDATAIMGLIFWAQGDSSLIKDVLEMSALKRDKWESHPTYLDRTIQNALNKHNGEYYRTPTLKGFSDIELDKIEKLSPLAVAQMALDKLPEFENMFAYDEYLRQYIFTGDPKIFGLNKKTGEPLKFNSKSIDTEKISSWFTREYGKAIPATTWASAIKGSNCPIFDSLIDWLTKDSQGNELKWTPNGFDYMNDCLVNKLHCEDTELNRAILRAFICNVVNRGVMGKYEKTFYKYVPVFYGAQDAGKSAFLDKLGNDFFSDEFNKFKVDNPRVNTILKKNSIIELGETGFFSKNNIEDVKQLVQQRQIKSNDFGSSEDETFNCRHVYAITANKLEFIRDSTGASRFYPLEISVNTDPRTTGADIASMDETYIKGLFSQALYYLQENGFDALKVPKSLDAELEAERLELQYKDENFATIEAYLNTEFPIDTFEIVNVTPWIRHKFDWEVLSAGEWTLEAYEDAQRTQSGQHDNFWATREPNEFAQVERVSLSEMMDLLGINQFEPYAKENCQSALELCGFKKYRTKGKDKRGVTMYGKKVNDLWIRERKGKQSKFSKINHLK